MVRIDHTDTVIHTLEKHPNQELVREAKLFVYSYRFDILNQLRRLING